MTFTAIDFELATADYTSVCAVGLVTIVDGQIVEEFHSLVRPPRNEYMWQTTRVHGLKAKDTLHAPSFLEVFEKIKPFIQNTAMLAHNEKFDREVLTKTMKLYNLDYKDLGLPEMWECTNKIYRAKGFKKTKLSVCCHIMGIELHHHDPLSDAKACAELFLQKDNITPELIALNFPAETNNSVVE